MNDDEDDLMQALRFAEEQAAKQKAAVKQLRRFGIDARKEEALLLLMLSSVQKHRDRLAAPGPSREAKPAKIIDPTFAENLLEAKLSHATLFLTRTQAGYRARLVMKAGEGGKQHVSVREVISPSEALSFGQRTARVHGIDKIVLVNRTGQKISGWPEDVNECDSRGDTLSACF